MDSLVPPSAAHILNLVKATETSRSDRSAYDVVYGHNEGRLTTPITSLTVDQLLASQSEFSRQYGSSASGAYQIIQQTLAGLKAELRLRGGQIFDPNLQDRLGYHLLKGRGYERWTRGEISDGDFALGLAKEWASFPVLQPVVKSNGVTVQRGSSYYGGDGRNKALVSPEALEAVLAEAKRLPHQEHYGVPQAPPIIVPPPLSGDVDPPWITVARSKIGVKEIPGGRHHPDILEFWKVAELPFKTDEVPWCAGYVGYCLETSGIQSTRSGLAASYLKWGIPLSKPQLGAVLVFNRTGGSGHVGFYVGEKDGRYLVLGGNQSDAVNVKAFNPSTLKMGGIRWPSMVPTVPVKPPPEEPIVPTPPPVVIPDPVLPPKPWYQSKVLIGAFVAIVLPLLGRYIPGLAGVQPAAATDTIIKMIDILGPLIGGGLIVQGRLTSTRPIAGTATADRVVQAETAERSRQVEVERSRQVEVSRPAYYPEPIAQMPQPVTERILDEQDIALAMDALPTRRMAKLASNRDVLTLILNGLEFARKERVIFEQRRVQDQSQAQPESDIDDLLKNFISK